MVNFFHKSIIDFYLITISIDWNSKVIIIIIMVSFAIITMA